MHVRQISKTHEFLLAISMLVFAVFAFGAVIVGLTWFMPHSRIPAEYALMLGVMGILGLATIVYVPMTNGRQNRVFRFLSMGPLAWVLFACGMFLTGCVMSALISGPISLLITFVTSAVLFMYCSSK